MKRSAITILVGLALLGCYCKRCQGQWVNDLIVTGTEAAEFRQLVLDTANESPDVLAEILFAVATGSKLPSATETVAINAAQSNRWFSTADAGSFVTRSYWRLGLVSVAQRKLMRPTVVANVQALATIKISNEAKRNRFLSRLADIHAPEVFE